MADVIIVFPKEENGRSIKNILVRSGYSVRAVCTTGAQVLQHARDMYEGIVICPPKLVDMMYHELCEYLPVNFEMLLLSGQSPGINRSGHEIICLSMPLKVHELLSTVEMMVYSVERKRKKRKAKPRSRSREEQELIDQAKALLMARNSMTEEEAHRYIQKISMDGGNSLPETAQMILAMR